MKSYYSDALNSDDNKIVHESNVDGQNKTEEINGISNEAVHNQVDFSFERYKDYKPEETQVCSNSLSRPAIITLIAILSILVVIIVVIIVVKSTEDKSKALEYKEYSVKNKEQAQKKGVNEAKIETSKKVQDDFEEELDIEDEGSDTPTQKPTVKPDNSIKIKKGLQDMVSTYPDVQNLIDNYDSYPERLLEDVVRNPEMLDFTLNYHNMVNKTYTDIIDISNDVFNTNYEIPLFIQWDSRWGYSPYSSGVIGISGCGPTCLSMVYVHLTRDITMNPLKMAKYSVDNGYVSVGVGTKWSLMTTGANSLGLQSEKISISESSMIEHLQQGHPLIASMGPGIFTDKGHFIVFRKYENGKFYVNDPFCKKNSNTAYSYSAFSSQIKGVWAYWR